MSKHLILDAMGVVFTVGDDTNELLVPFIRQRTRGITREYINDMYLRATLGQMSSKEFWRRVGLGDDYPDVEKEYLDTQLIILRCPPEECLFVDDRGKNLVPAASMGMRVLRFAREKSEGPKYKEIKSFKDLVSLILSMSSKESSQAK